MNTRNMPNMAKALSGALDQNTIRALMQSLGNCAQPLSHSGGMSVSGPVTFGSQKNVYAGDYQGGDVNNTIYGDDNRSWNANDNRQFIQNHNEYLSTFTNEYNEGDVWTQYNDNSVWDMSQWSRTTNYNMATHITHGDQFSFPTTNYSEQWSFTEGNTITFEGPVTHKNLTIHEGDTVLNLTEEGDTYNITNEGDTYTETTNNITEVVNEIKNVYEGDEHYHTHVHNKFVTEVTQKIVEQIINQHTHIHQYFNDYITNIIINGPDRPIGYAGPFMAVDAPLKTRIPGVQDKYVASVTIDLSGVTVDTSGISFDTSSCEITGNTALPLSGTPTVTLTHTTDTSILIGDVYGATGSSVAGPGLQQGRPWYGLT